MVTKPLVFESTLSVVSKLLRSCKHSPCHLNQHDCRRTL
jgi:hypothetical protein